MADQRKLAWLSQKSSWARLGSNQRPLACEASALPLSYAPWAQDCSSESVANRAPGHQRLMPSVPAFLSARAMRRLDVALAIWAAFWIGIATYTAYEVAALRALSSTVVKAGAATISTGHALAAVGHLPFVGGRISQLAAQAIAAGASARASGASTGTTIDQLAVLLGIAIALIPTVPLLGLYVPLRLGWRRERNAVRHAIARWDGEPGLEAFLAERALAHLPYEELRDLGYDGTRGSPPNAELAVAELRRLGLDRGARRVVAPRRPHEPVNR